MTNAVHIGVFLLFSLTLFASGPDLERDDLVVSVRSPRTVVPGQFETFILEISNDYDYPLDLEVSVDMPSSWRILSPIKSVHLEPGEKRSLVFLMDIDRACEVGEKNIRFRFYDVQRQVKIEKTIVTSVENIHKLEARAIRYPNHLMSGQDFEVDFVVRNLGNCYENVRISSEEGTLSVAELVLPPNSSSYIKVSQRAPDLVSMGYVTADIKLETDSADKPLIEKVSIRTYPKVTKRTDPYQRFPIRASLIYFGAHTKGEYRDGYQFEFEGRGFIDKDKNHHLYLRTRGPSRFSIARVGNYDQYTAEYKWQQSRTKQMTVSLGDFAYNLTPITEMYRWARGVGVNQKFEKLEIGGFYNEPRFMKGIDRQFAAYANYLLLPEWNVKLSAMHKDFSDNRSGGQLLSLRNSIKFADQVIHAEYAMGTMEGAVGSAMNLEMTGGIKKLRLSYTSQNVYADNNFPGYYSNSIYSVSNLRYRHRKFAVSTGFSYNDANPSLDTIRTSSPYSTNTFLRFTYLFSRDFRMALSGINRSKEDRFPNKKFWYRENVVLYTVNYSNKTWSALLNAELTQTQNLLLPAEHNTATGMSLRSSVEGRITRQLKAAVFGQYLLTNRYTEERQRYILYGGSLGYQMNEHFNVQGSYRNNYLLEEYNSDRSLIDFRVGARYGMHQFSMALSHALVRNTVNRTDFYVNARYTCHINTPVRKKKGLYSLSGVIETKARGDAKGIVLHMAGQSVITNEYGRFEFNDLPPGLHYLHMDLGTVGIGLMAAGETPLEVQILPKAQNTINLELVRSGSIVGKVDFGESVKKSENGEENLPLRIIKATSGNRELLTYTDENGNFSFMQVFPGEWKVRLVENTPGKSEWELEQNNVVLDVKPSESVEMEFKMTKKERKIRFKNQKAFDLKIKKD